MKGKLWQLNQRTNKRNYIFKFTICAVRPDCGRHAIGFSRITHAETMEEAMRIMAPGTEHGTFVGMVIGYWEQACALLNYGLAPRGSLL